MRLFIIFKIINKTNTRWLNSQDSIPYLKSLIIKLKEKISTLSESPKDFHLSNQGNFISQTATPMTSSMSPPPEIPALVLSVMEANTSSTNLQIIPRVSSITFHQREKLESPSVWEEMYFESKVRK